MNIRNWPFDRIMQLPDWCFGRRWPIGLQAVLTDDAPVFDISEAALPETTVIWELAIQNLSILASALIVTLSIGDQLPASDAAFNVCELVFPGIESTTGVRGAVDVMDRGALCSRRLRIPVATAGRRLVGRFLRDTGSAVGGQAIIVVSSIPTEVPDWLCSQKV